MRRASTFPVVGVVSCDAVPVTVINLCSLACACANSRAIGRIAGQGGKTRHAIENATRTRIIVADQKVHILGSFSNIKVCGLRVRGSRISSCFSRGCGGCPTGDASIASSLSIFDGASESGGGTMVEGQASGFLWTARRLYVSSHPGGVFGPWGCL